MKHRAWQTEADIKGNCYSLSLNFEKISSGQAYCLGSPDLGRQLPKQMLSHLLFLFFCLECKFYLLLLSQLLREYLGPCRA